MPSREQTQRALDALEKLKDLELTAGASIPLYEYLIATMQEERLLISGERYLSAVDVEWFKHFELLSYLLRRNRRLRLFYEEAMFCVAHALPYDRYTEYIWSRILRARSSWKIFSDGRL